MEQIIANQIAQFGVCPLFDWDAACSYWHWVFCAGLVVGAVGGILCFFLKPMEPH